MSPQEASALGCVQSSLDNHMILFSQFNDMLGEWYDRTLVGLLVFLQDHQVPLQTFAQTTRLYIHRMDMTKPLLNTHHLLTEAFRTTPLGDVLELLDSPRCVCLPRVLFCGYNTKLDETDGRTQLTPAYGMFRRDNKRHWQKRLSSDLRNLLRKQLVTNNPLVQTDMQDYRQSLLKRYVFGAVRTQTPTTAMTNNAGDWKIVGLTQRTGRRRWHNLQQVLNHLTASLHAKRILVVEINVEDPEWTPYQHLVRHSGLDALIGIHGAQLTEAVWMKPGSLVVEILPYIPEGIAYGRWATYTHQPTPLGIIFDGTDLLHVGYKLERESAPYCYNSTTLDCWQAGSFPWDQRDFIAPAEAIERMIDVFMVHRPETCDDYRELSQASTNFVVYNAQCFPAGSTNNSIGTRHFYW